MEEEFKDQISSYNLGELDESQKKAFEERMAREPMLAREVRLDKELDQVLSDQDNLAFREQLEKTMQEEEKQRGLPAWLLLAATILIILGISMIYLFRGEKTIIRQEHRQPPVVQHQQKPVPAPLKPIKKPVVDDNKLAYTPCPELEEMVRIHYRDNSKTLISPGKDTDITADPWVLFKWEPVQQDTAMIKLFDNRNRLIYQTKPKAADFLRIRIQLKPGLYYWQLILNRELHSVGRLIMDP